jgi:hypothetical protein
MSEDSNFPKVLLVSSAKVKAEDPSYLLVRTEFGGWPKERLAQIFASDDLAGYGEFCGHNYQLDTCDRFFGKYFRKLRGRVSDMVAPDSIKPPSNATVGPALGRWSSRLRKRLGDWLISSGLWELIFHVRLSVPMADFIGGFRPDLIYCQGYSLGFTTLPLLIARRFNIPICFQTTDDWPSYTYRRSPVGWLLRRRTRQLIQLARVRMAFGEKMKRAFEHRYQQPFLVTYHADRSDRFLIDTSTEKHKKRSIVFTGSLALKRYEAIADLLTAVRSLESQQLSIELLVYSSSIPKAMPESLRSVSGINFLPLPSHDLLPSVLAEADILFLPESFSVEPEMIELSISTKCHLYMMSKRPVLVYGPSYCGTVDYALREGWAAVVTERNTDSLRLEVKNLLTDCNYSNHLSQKASTVVMCNHELQASRLAFQQTLVASLRTQT